MSDERRIPPSFTPAGRRSSRPDQSGDAISVGRSSARPPAGGTPRRDDAVPMDQPEPRVRRQSSREIPVSPQRRSALPASSPRSYEAQAGRQGRPAAYPPARGGQPAGGSQPARGPQQTRVSPAARPPSQRPSGGRPGGRPPAAGRPPGRPPAAGGGNGIRVRKRRVAGLVLVMLLVLVLAWPIGLVVWANGKLQHVDALSGASGTPGTTYLLAGTDERGSGGVDDGTEGVRTDTIMVLHTPRSGPSALISIPRDTYAEIPGRNPNKVNAAYAFGGPPLLVETVEELTGLTIDHYAEVGFGSLEDLVDAVDGVELCLDYDVSDRRSELEWEAGCHLSDGETALAFSRMRYSDPLGDIGRAERQRQVISALSEKVVQPSVLLNPVDEVQLIQAGTNALVVSEGTGLISLGRLALAFRAATGPEGVTGTPPIANPGYNPGGGVGSTVLLDPDTVDDFWVDVRDGNLEPGSTVGGL